MIYSLLVLTAPYSQQSSHTAFQFAKTSLSLGHRVHRIFFYSDGVQTASRFTTPPQDEINLSQEWKLLAEEHQFELIVCVSAALRRGILNEQEAKRYQREGNNLLPPFEISGLGQLVEATIVSDRFITFGA